KENELTKAKSQLASVEHELKDADKFDNQKLMKAAGSVVASINAKYIETKKELDTVKEALAKLRAEYQAAKSQN
ncbi:MAG: hypothetical protein EB158_09220, partial [Nitrosopumilaceae archaeon]|nr:hypothetical protein [Nitrosopumilaceae archaeon]